MTTFRAIRQIPSDIVYRFIDHIVRPSLLGWGSGTHLLSCVSAPGDDRDPTDLDDCIPLMSTNTTNT